MTMKINHTNWKNVTLAVTASLLISGVASAGVPPCFCINTLDVITTEGYFLGITPLAGCRLDAADVNGDTFVNTQDVIAIQRFFLGRTNGIGRAGTAIGGGCPGAADLYGNTFP
jgi:hypothetical protein